LSDPLGVARPGTLAQQEQTVANDLIETQPSISALAREHGVSRTIIRRWLSTGWTPQLPAPGQTLDSVEVIEAEIVEQNQLVSTPSTPERPPLDMRVDAGALSSTAAVHPWTPYASTPGRRWRAVGRVSVGLAIVGTGAFIAFTSMQANSWFGHALTPDPVAGEVYSRLSVAAEVIACLIPTGIRFYWANGEAWSAVRGWALMAVALVVVFFAAGGFAVTNLNAGIEARAERETPAMRDLRNQVAGLDRSISSECAKRGDRCRDLERQRAEANAKLAAERASLKTDADPQASALGVTSATLHLVQAGAMVALCLFSGLFISFGAGLIWPRGRAA
jgi:hypothetical protein